MKAIHRFVLTLLVLTAPACWGHRQVPLDQVTPTEVASAKHITLWTGRGKVWTLEHATLQDSAITGDVVAGPRRVLIPLRDVTKVEVSWREGGKTALAVVGGIAGTIAVLAIVAAAAKESCPFLYAQDSTGLELQGELYSGAVFPALQRADYLAIGHLAPVGGQYTLKLADEARETQYTDELALLVIDHEPGVRVLPDEQGTLHAIAEARPPLAAHDLQGKDVLRQVQAADTLTWTADPFQRDTSDPAQLRDGVVLRFRAPAPGANPRLVVRIRNTAWADYLFGRYLALMGGALHSWTMAQTGADTRQRVERFMRMQGLSLSVDLQNGGTWANLAAFHPTGPIAWQDEVLPLPVTALTGDTVIVRLQGGALFWAIDFVALEAAPEQPLRVQLLHPVSALADDGSNPSAALQAPDGHYQVLPEPGRSVLVHYAAPPRAPGLARSFVVRSNGYYTIHQTSETAPDYVKLAALQEDPYGLLRFSLREYWRLSGHQAALPAGR